MNDSLFSLFSTPIRKMNWWEEIIACFGKKLEIFTACDYDFYEVNGNIYVLPRKEELDDIT